MRTASRIMLCTIALTAVIASGVCATGSYLWYKIAPDYPEDESDTIDIPGLTAPVRVYLDEAGIAHIDAQNDADLLRAAGHDVVRVSEIGMALTMSSAGCSTATRPTTSRDPWWWSNPGATAFADW